MLKALKFSLLTTVCTRTPLALPMPRAFLGLPAPHIARTLRGLYWLAYSKGHTPLTLSELASMSPLQRDWPLGVHLALPPGSLPLPSTSIRLPLFPWMPLLPDAPSSEGLPPSEEMWWSLFGTQP